MRILHLTTFLQGGAGRVIADLAIAQRHAGHQTSVVTSKTGAPGYGNYDGYLADLEANGVPLQLVDSTFVRDHAAHLAVVRALEGAYPPGQEPDVIHTHAAIPSLVALAFAETRRRPIAIVQTMHGWGVAKSPAQVETDIALLNRVHRVAVPSVHASTTMTALGVDAARLIVVPYGVREVRRILDAQDRTAAHAMARARSRGALVIACVGTIGRRKNQALLVEALAIAQPRVRTFCLFVGDGDVDSFRATADAADAHGDIRVHGYSRAARALASLADVLVLPSSSEGQPVAVLEAFCDRTLVAVSDIPELTELVEPGATGVHFAAGDAHALADALVRIARMPATARRLIQNRAHALYVSRFSTTSMIDAYRNLYETADRAVTDGHGSRAVSAA